MCHGSSIYQPLDDEGPRGPRFASVVAVSKLYPLWCVWDKSNAANYRSYEDDVEGKFADSFDGSGEGSQGNVRKGIAAVRDCWTDTEGDLQTLASQRLSVCWFFGRGSINMSRHRTGDDSGKPAGGACQTVSRCL